MFKLSPSLVASKGTYSAKCSVKGVRCYRNRVAGVGRVWVLLGRTLGWMLILRLGHIAAGRSIERSAPMWTYRQS